MTTPTVHTHVFDPGTPESAVGAALAARLPQEVFIDDGDRVLVAFGPDGQAHTFDPDTLRAVPRRATGTTTVATADSLLKLLDFTIDDDTPIVVQAHHPSSLNADVDVILDPTSRRGNGRGGHKIALRPGQHPRFTRWARVAGSAPAVDTGHLPWLNQAQFRDQLLDRPEEITSPDAATVSEWARGVHVEVTGRDRAGSDRRTSSAMRDQEIVKQVVGDAKPDKLTIRVPFFVTRDAVTLGLEIDMDGPDKYRFRWIDRDTQLEEEIAAIHELIVAGLPSSAVFVHV